MRFYLNTNLAFLIEMFNGDVFKTLVACEKFGGLNISIPKKTHRKILLKELIKKGESLEEIAKKTKIDKDTLQEYLSEE